MSLISRSAQVCIDLEALRHNLERVRSLAPGRRVLAMVKADAYGHGLVSVSRVLASHADGLGVACVSEAIALREAGVSGRIVVMQGFKNAGELEAAYAHALDVVVHESGQIERLENYFLGQSGPLTIWLKIDTGMHRIGFPPERIGVVRDRLLQLPGVDAHMHYLSHFACADDPVSELTDRQIIAFRQALEGLPGERSLCNSAAIMRRPDAHADWVRPGIMLYGASPFAEVAAVDYDLHPVMTLQAPLIAIHRRHRGESIGYGYTYRCPHDMRIGIVAIGYGDGYPRHAPNGTPASLDGSPVSLVGRVSMDMLAIDLRDVACQAGDLVTLWGRGQAADEVAAYAQTISYELFCAAGPKAQRLYI